MSDPVKAPRVTDDAMRGVVLVQFYSFVRSIVKIVGGGLVTTHYMGAGDEHMIAGTSLIVLGVLFSMLAHLPRSRFQGIDD